MRFLSEVGGLPFLRQVLARETLLARFGEEHLLWWLLGLVLLLSRQGTDFLLSVPMQQVLDIGLPSLSVLNLQASLRLQSYRRLHRRQLPPVSLTSANVPLEYSWIVITCCKSSSLSNSRLSASRFSFRSACVSVLRPGAFIARASCSRLVSVLRA